MFAAVCVLLASTGHVLMSGQDLPAPALGLAFVGTLAVAWILAGRERGLLAVTTASVVVQGLLHAVFSGYRQHGPVPVPHTAMGRADTGGHADMAPMPRLTWTWAPWTRVTEPWVTRPWTPPSPPTT
ncbi:hypothetical protein [Streptomyces globisporus]|uniref:hypothetical protein n=1 Tax=Streptomyces globisporus TaxID=1908 RepID=UPI000B1D2F59|nr:hypothetical protein [Streptomyces globisporus]